jgi:hypothetical protein
MKTLILLLLFCLPAVAQNPDTAKYSQRQIFLVDPTSGSEAIAPLLVPLDGQQRLEFVPTSKLKEFLDKGAQPVRLADILSLLGSSAEKINQLQAENDRLWKIAMKDSPKSESVIVQQTPLPAPTYEQFAAQRQADAIARRQQTLLTWMALQNSNKQQPYQLPAPVNPNFNRLQTNCTSYKVGDQVRTNCN